MVLKQNVARIERSDKLSGGTFLECLEVLLILFGGIMFVAAPLVVMYFFWTGLLESDNYRENHHKKD